MTYFFNGREVNSNVNSDVVPTQTVHDSQTGLNIYHAKYLTGISDTVLLSSRVFDNARYAIVTHVNKFALDFRHLSVIFFFCR